MLVNDISNLMDKKLVEDIVSLDFRQTSPFVDYFLIGTVRNSRMANSVIDEISKYCKDNNILIKSINNNTNSNWNLIDIGSIVVHLFSSEERIKYDLEGLWKDLIEK